MENEIEIKLIATKDIEKSINNISKKQGVKLVGQSFKLENIYFDTATNLLRQWDMGLRIRVNDQHIEQTIKTAGEVIGGLHQRPEYNIDITSKTPQLALFPQQIWPKNCDVELLQRELNPLFTTDFSRKGYMMIYPEGSVVEMVFDQGFIASGGNRVEICEVELELIKGKPEVIFDLADNLAKSSPIRFGNDSKAARGYRLAQAKQLSVKPLKEVSLSENDSLEQAYIKTLNHGLSHWQHHIEVFIAEHDYLALKEIRGALQLIIKANEIYRGYFHSNDLKELTKSLFWLMETLSFIDESLRIDKLLENKGSRFKKLEQHKQILRLLTDQRASLPAPEHIEILFNSEQHTLLVASLIKWLYFKPWRQQSMDSVDKFQQSAVSEHARDFLAKDWESIQKTLPYESNLGYQDYLAQRFNLQQNLQVGYCVGQLFDVALRDRFRAPWLDIGVGIDELLQFEPIKQLLRDELLDDEDSSIKSWLIKKESSLIHAMEQSRKAALKMVPYWD